MNYKKFRFSVVFLAIITVYFFVPKVNAFEFNQNNIITDFELFDYDSLTVNEIQNFLEKHESLLADYETLDVDGRVKKASQIIYDSAHRNKVSPKFILVKIDHEQALVRKESFKSDTSRDRALKWATGFSVCDGCTLSQKYAGFAKQVDAVAGVQHDYIRKEEKFKVKVGQPYVTKDGFTVVPENQATRNLYIYTPWRGEPGGVGGNYFFAKLWQEYFGRNKYPEGTVLRDKNDNLWLIKNGERRKYRSRSTFLANNSLADAVSVSDKDLESYPKGPEIKFANYSLLKTPDAARYLVVNETIRRIKDDETFRTLGFNPEELIDVAQSDLAAYEIGAPIGPRAIFPTGAVVKVNGSPDLYWVVDGRKHYIPDESIYKINFGGQPPIIIDTEQFENLFQGDPVMLKDGALVKSPDGKFFVISNKAKLLIEGVEDLVGLFGKERLVRVTQVSQYVLDMHKTGDTLVYIDPNPKNVPVQTASNPTDINNRDYIGRMESLDAPKTLLNETEAKVVLTFRNVGTEAWTINDVVLTIVTPEGAKSPYKASGWNGDFGHIALPNDVKPNDTVNISFNIKGSGAGKNTVRIGLEKKDGNRFSAVRGAGAQFDIQMIASDYSANIINDNFIPAVKNDFETIDVNLTIKNTGKNAWTRKRTALEVLSISDGPSPFYDPNDWIDRQIAAISINPKLNKILPGASAEYAFTLKVGGLRPGVYTYKLSLTLKDKDGQAVLLNGQKKLIKEIRIDE